MHRKGGLRTTPDNNSPGEAQRGERSRAGLQLIPTLRKTPRNYGQPNKSTGRWAGRMAGTTEKPPGYQSSQKQSGRNKMEGIDLRKCNKCREMVDKIPQEATAGNKGFLEAGGS